MNYLQALGSQTPAEVETLTAEIQVYKQQAGACIVEIGRRLIKAKELLPHGAWREWLSEKVEFSERTAQNFMRVAKEYSNPQPVADLGLAKALLLLQLPEGEREAFMETPHVIDGGEKTVQEMSRRELERVIRERDEARKQAEQAQADAEKWKNTADAKEISLKNAKEKTRKAEAAVKAAQADSERSAAARLEAETRRAELERKLRELEDSAKAEPLTAEVVPDEETIQRLREGLAAEIAAEKQQELAEAEQRAGQAEEALRKARNVEAIRVNMVFVNLQDIDERLSESLRTLDAEQPDTAGRFRAAIADFYESRAQTLREMIAGGT